MIQTFDSDGVPIAFIDEGEGAPVLLIHGFASNRRVNWVSTSWVRDLTAAGRRVLTFDNRGHGDRRKPHEPASYSAALMARDAERLLDHVGIERADVVGYSMGARITAFLALESPERVRRAVLGGMGERMVKPLGPTPEAIAAALLAASPEDVVDPVARAFRTFAEQTGADREALAACVLGSWQTMTPEELGRISVPVLVAVGSEDIAAGSPQAVAALIPGAEVFAIPGRDHMKAVGDRAHKAAVLEFLERQP